MAFDPTARGLAASEIARAKRLRILNTLRASMARSGMRPPELDTTVPTFGAATASTSIPAGTTHQLYVGGVAQDTVLSRFTLVGADWSVKPGAFPNTEMAQARASWQGDGTPGNIQTVPNLGGRVRFATATPLFEIYFQCAAGGGGNGFRLKVNGKYVTQGVKGTDGNGLIRYIPVQWGDGTAAYRKMRQYELELYSVGSFLGLRMGNLDRPRAWPQPDALKGVVIGDSFDATIQDSGDKDAWLTPSLGFAIADLLGQSDVVSSGVGGSGWTNGTGHNTFAMRWPYDVVARAPDFVIEHGGGNDTVTSASQAAYEAVIDAALQSTFAAKPETIVFLFSHISANVFQYVHQAKQNIAAKYPKNVGFIDTYTDPLIYGSGKQGAPTGDGNRDWAIGPDSAHPTLLGHDYLASAAARGIAKAIATLIAAQG